MSRLTIDITDQQHQALKAMAALAGKSINQFALERLFDLGEAGGAALRDIKALLAERVTQAQRGEVVQGSISELAEQAVRKEPSA